MRIRRGKAWGNALGGYKKQRRDSAGRFAGGGIPATPKRVKRVASKNKDTSLFLKKNRSQQQFKNGSLHRQAGLIPYTRHGFSSHTAGVNGGLRILPNYRLSGGAYLKIQNIDKTRREKELREADDKIILGLASKVSPHPALDGLAAGYVKKVRRSQIDKLVGGEARVGKKSYARVTTDQNAMPTVTIEYNRSAKRTARRQKARPARRKAVWAYNDMVTKGRGSHVSTPRPQRRGK